MFLASLQYELYAGLNYTAFRFLLAPLAVVCVFSLLRRYTLGAQAGAVLLVAAFTAVLLFISPEIAVAFALGSAAFFLPYLFKLGGKSLFLLYPLLLVLLALLMVAAYRLKVFTTMQAFSSGGFNFPIIPSPSILLFLFSLAVCAQLAASALARGAYLTNTIYLLAVAVPMLAPALGRCDPGHIYWNGAAILLVGMLWASSSNRTWKWYRVAFAVIFVGLGTVSNLYLYRVELARTTINLVLAHAEGTSYLSRSLNHLIYTHLGHKADKLRLLAQQDASQDPVLLPPQVHGVASAPFSYEPSHNPTALYLGYYWGLLNALDSKAVNDKISELDQHRDQPLILPKNMDAACVIDAAASRQFIGLLFMYPYRGQVVHPQSVYQPLCSYIHAHYVLSVPSQASTYGYEIWSRSQ